MDSGIQNMTKREREKYLLQQNKFEIDVKILSFLMS